MRDTENGGGEWVVKSPFQNGEIREQVGDRSY